MPITSSVRDLTKALLAQPKLTRVDVEPLLARTMSDGKLSSAERKQIQTVIDKFSSQGDSADAVNHLKGFMGIKGDSLRALVHTSEANDGVIDAAEARKILDGLGTQSASNGKASLQAILIGSKLTPEAKAVLSGDVGGGGGAGALVSLGLPKLDGIDYQLAAGGYLTSGKAVSFDAAGALDLYRGAEALIAAPGTPLAGLSTAQKTGMLSFLDKQFAAGKDTHTLPEVSTQRIRSAAATTLLCLIEGAKPADGALKGDAIKLYLAQAKSEPLHGLRASMYFNLDRLKNVLDPAQTKLLADLKPLVVPEKPAYDTWFKDNGKRAINIEHYAHDDCWTNGVDPVAQYKAMGFTLVDSKPNAKPPSWILEKTNNGAPGGPVSARVEVKRTHDGIFQKMDDPKTNVVLYTGHSNLGGNVSEELRLGPEEKSSKLILLAMCRGKQNMAEVANKYPSSHFITTDQPSYFSSVMPIAMNVVDSALNLRDFDGMAKSAPPISDAGGGKNYFYPNEERRYAYYDVDKDGLVDGKGANVDRLFNISLRPPETRRTDGVVRPNALNARDIDATWVDHATSFLNTITSYHVDHGGNTSKFAAKDMDNWKPAGFFDGPVTEKVRLSKNADGTVGVAVNKGLSDQSWAVVGTIVQYEACKQELMQRNGGKLTKEDEGRAMLFAGEYLSYMYCSLDEAEKGIAAITKDSTFFKGTSYPDLEKAVGADDHGYATDVQMKALLKLRNI